MEPRQAPRADLNLVPRGTNPLRDLPVSRETVELPHGYKLPMDLEVPKPQTLRRRVPRETRASVIRGG
jgi:hypothetical protein